MLLSLQRCAAWQSQHGAACRSRFKCHSVYSQPCHPGRVTRPPCWNEIPSPPDKLVSLPPLCGIPCPLLYTPTASPPLAHPLSHVPSLHTARGTPPPGSSAAGRTPAGVGREGVAAAPGGGEEGGNARSGPRCRGVRYIIVQTSRKPDGRMETTSVAANTQPARSPDGWKAGGVTHGTRRGPSTASWGRFACGSQPALQEGCSPVESASRAPGRAGTPTAGRGSSHGAGTCSSGGAAGAQQSTSEVLR